MLTGKLQLRPGMTVAVIEPPDGFSLDAAAGDVDSAEAVVVFVTSAAQLEARRETLQDAAARGALTWLAYPKAGQLSTDLNRDRIREGLQASGLDTVRQIAIDDLWSALRLRSAAA